MHDTIPDKLGMLQSRDHPEYPLLFRKFETSLKPDEIVEVTGLIVLAKLDACVRSATGAGIRQANGLSGPNRIVSDPLAAIVSIGMHPSNTASRSKSLMSAFSALSKASTNRSYSSWFIGQFK